MQPFETPDSSWLTQHVLPLIPKQTTPVILAIGGPSGVGKSTLAATIAQFLNTSGQRAITLSMDDFFKDPQERAVLDEWSPRHIRFQHLQHTLQAMRCGQHPIETLRYVRRPHPHLQSWTIPLQGVRVVVFEGLYALSNDPACGNLVAFAHARIYLDAPTHLLKNWRFQQEAAKPRGRSTQAMEQHWAQGILPDTRDRVRPSQHHAQLALEKNEAHQLRITH